MSETDIRKAIYNALENTDTNSEDRISYRGFDSDFENENGISEIRIIISEGQVRTAWLEGGDAVWKYVSEGDVGWIKEG